MLNYMPTFLVTLKSLGQDSILAKEMLIAFETRRLIFSLFSTVAVERTSFELLGSVKCPLHLETVVMGEDLSISKFTKKSSSSFLFTTPERVV